MTLILPPVWIMVLLHFQVGLSLNVIPKRALQELEALQKLLPPLKDERLEWVQTRWLVPIASPYIPI